MLIPVLLGGLLKSVEQVLTGRKIPFCRTPKVPGRTAAPALYAAIELVLPLACFDIGASDITQHNWMQAQMAFVNGLFFCYALVSYIGVGAVLQDIMAGAKDMWRSLASKAEDFVAPVRRFPLFLTTLQRG